MQSLDLVTPPRHSGLHRTALVDTKPDPSRYGHGRQGLRSQSPHQTDAIPLAEPFERLVPERRILNAITQLWHLLTRRRVSVMRWLPGRLIGFGFQKTAMLGRGIAAEVNTADTAASRAPLPGRSAGSSVHGIELSVLALWASIEALRRNSSFAQASV